MVIFATPTWGYAMHWPLIVVAAVLAISLVGIVLGVRLLGSKAFAGRKFGGCVLLLVGCLLIIWCYSAWPNTIPLENGTHPIGSYPNNKILEGMSRDEVKATLGLPFRREEYNDQETWIYLIDSYGDCWFGVSFGPDGRVDHTYGD